MQNPILDPESLYSKEDEGFIIIDKEVGPTSFGVVARVKGMLRSAGAPKRIKVGHSGTLDPFASGLLILFIGRNYTRKAAQTLLGNKTYIATLQLGISTDSYDHTGKPEQTSDAKPTHTQLLEAIAQFQGHTAQRPPMFSAKKINGKRLYTLAREGKTTDLPTHNVWMQIKLLSYHYPYVTIEVLCSKGTYIRALAHDLGLNLQTYAHLTQLYRTQALNFALPIPEMLNDPSPLTVDPQQLRSSLHRTNPASVSLIDLNAGNIKSLPLLNSEQLDRSLPLDQRLKNYRSALLKNWPFD